MIIKTKCKGCGAIFIATRKDAKYHSESCRQKHWKRGKRKKRLPANEYAALRQAIAAIRLELASFRKRVDRLEAEGYDAFEDESLLGANGNARSTS